MRQLTALALRVVKEIFLVLGVEIQRARNSLSEKNVLAQFFQAHVIDIVFDVGANIGQYHDLLREIGYANDIISFEPLSGAHDSLIKLAASDQKWVIAERQALGSSDSEILINVAGNSASSSILPMLDRHRVAAPQSEYVSRELVPMKRLDSISAQYLTGRSSGLLKIDTQGYELEVLSGADSVLHQFIAIQVELSLVPLYDNQSTFAEICAYLSERGFQLKYIIPGFRDPGTHELLQVDGIFVRS